jgi:hypothetical protein
MCKSVSIIKAFQINAFGGSNIDAHGGVGDEIALPGKFLKNLLIKMQ